MTDKQGIKLREEIERVLSPEDKLKNIFKEYPDKFRANFYNQISGDDYRTRLINLITELNNLPLIDDFIEIVSKDYSSIKERYQIYLQLSPLIFLLKEIFQKYQNFRDFFGDFGDIDGLEDYLLKLTEKNNLLLSDIDSFSLKSYPGFMDFVEQYLAKILTA
ncbi:MAG: hypothetical protein MGF17_08085, partial [Trichodesmium sp. MAG_R04]|nr:hypothetical protein [Trichodesmium sp. MAG_R04]